MLKNSYIQLAKNSFVFGIGTILQRFIGLMLLPFFTHALTPKDFGVVALISLIGLAISGLFTLGTGNSMGVLYYREQNVVKRPSIIWSNILLLTLNGVFWYSFLFQYTPFLSELIFQTDRYAYLIQLTLLTSVFNAIADPWLAYLRMENKAKSYVLITLISSLISIGLSTWFVLVEGIGVKGIILASTLTQAAMLGINWLMIGRKLPFHIDFNLFNPLIRIGFPSIFGMFAFLLIDFADRQMIERMVGLSALGIYSVGYSFGMVMIVAMGAFSTAWPTFFMSYINKHNEARTVFSKVLTYYLIVFGVLTVLFFSVAKPVVFIMTASTFHEAYIVVGLIAAAYMLKGCYLIMLPGIYFSEKLYKQSLVEWVAAIINIFLNLWLIRYFGIIGAAIATLISYMTLPIFAWLVARQYLEVTYQWDRISKISITTFLTCGLLYLLSTQLHISLILTILINAVVLFIFINITYRYFIEINERKQLWAIFHNEK